MDALIPLLLVSVSAFARAEPLREALRRRSDAGVYASGYEHDYEPYMFAAIPLHPPVPVLHVLSPGPSGRRALRHAASDHRAAYATPPYSRTFYGSADFTKASYTPEYAITSYGQPDYLHSYSEYRRPSYQQYQRPSLSQTEYAKPSYVEPNYLRYGFADLPPELAYTRPNVQLSSAEMEYSPQAFSQSHSAMSQAASQETAPNVLYAKPTAQGGYSYHKEPTKKHSTTKKAPKNKEPPVIIRVHKYKITRS